MCTYKTADRHVFNTVLSPCMECHRDGHDVTCLRILVCREECTGRKYKGITMAQWDNRLQNNIFVYRMW